MTLQETDTEGGNMKHFLPSLDESQLKFALSKTKPRSRLVVLTKTGEEQEVTLINFNQHCKPPFFFAKLFKSPTSTVAGKSVKYLLPQVEAAYVVDFPLYVKFVHQGQRKLRSTRINRGLTANNLLEHATQELDQYCREYLQTAVQVTDVIHNPDHGFGGAVFTTIEYEGKTVTTVSKDSFIRENIPILMEALSPENRLRDGTFETYLHPETHKILALVKPLCSEQEWAAAASGETEMEHELEEIEKQTGTIDDVVVVSNASPSDAASSPALGKLSFSDVVDCAQATDYAAENTRSAASKLVSASAAHLNTAAVLAKYSTGMDTAASAVDSVGAPSTSSAPLDEKDSVPASGSSANAARQPPYVSHLLESLPQPMPPGLEAVEETPSVSIPGLGTPDEEETPPVISRETPPEEAANGCGGEEEDESYKRTRFFSVLSKFKWLVRQEQSGDDAMDSSKARRRSTRYFSFSTSSRGPAQSDGDALLPDQERSSPSSSPVEGEEEGGSGSSSHSRRRSSVSKLGFRNRPKEGSSERTTDSAHDESGFTTAVGSRIRAITYALFGGIWGGKEGTCDEAHDRTDSSEPKER